jgi:pyruvate formate lyase activating enzyme
MYDTAVIAKSKGIGNVLVSNGYINEEPLRKLAPKIDAANIDLKSFSNDIYLRLNAGTLEPVLNTLRILLEMNVWVEITNLVIPTWTDDFDMIRKMCQWLANNGFSEVPLHFSRFFPLYKLTQLPQTPTSTLIKAREIAQSCGLKYVYIGNAALPGAGDTHCPSCGNVVIERKAFNVTTTNLKNGKCKWCGTAINGSWG